MAPTLLLFAGSAAAIYFACEFFVNGIEWVGHKWKVGRTATGTILAAFGTALPESVVTLVAVAFSGGGRDQQEIGIGAALGGPLVLATLAYAVVGMGLPQRERLAMDQGRLAQDQAWFLAIFVFKIALGLIAFAWKPGLGILFLLAYAVYFRAEMTDEGMDEAVVLEPLKLQPRAREPSGVLVALQTGAALAVIFAASRVFVAQLEAIGVWLTLPPQLVALLLSPIATEMPEVVNALIWVRQGKIGLALGNISGSMMIQATVPSAFGLFFTPWLFDRSLLAAGIVTGIAVLGLAVMFRRGAATGRRLALAGLLYALFVGGLAL